MSVLLVAIGTTRAKAACGGADYLLARGVDVGLITVEAEPWRREGLDPRVRLYALAAGEQRHPAARLGRAVRRVSAAAYTKVFGKFYRLLRPYVLWRVVRADVLRQVDWAAVEQLVICDSHAIPIGWHLARRHPGLSVGFELDRGPYLDREPVCAPVPPPVPVPASGSDIDA
ncbi:hypothetical protein KGA66_23590 [Actinocrinis puniceicyclus]|uniref:Uncharacterized protein n=1 Tax=Actinocrinis puniceicyclus TaxID=977794 RepID=A0A8J7WR92_9ACTN|nr:hypothetical protein [Actinocrinis puniceicyclus]MBS2966048.1 hypothetical protein [Actinocrinis puniceicyclus]